MASKAAREPSPDAPEVPHHDDAVQDARLASLRAAHAAHVAQAAAAEAAVAEVVAAMSKTEGLGLSEAERFAAREAVIAAVFPQRKPRRWMQRVRRALDIADTGGGVLLREPKPAKRP